MSVGYSMKRYFMQWRGYATRRQTTSSAHVQDDWSDRIAEVGNTRGDH